MKNLFLLFILINFFSCKSVQPIDSESFQNMRLHDIWALTKMNEEPINHDKTQRVPSIEIHVNKKKLYGNDGCNEFSGNIKILDNTKIEFEQIRVTTMACMKMELPNEFQLRMKEVQSYQLKGLQLFLLNKKNKVLLQFKKVD